MFLDDESGVDLLSVGLDLTLELLDLGKQLGDVAVDLRDDGLVEVVLPLGQRTDDVRGEVVRSLSARPPSLSAATAAAAATLSGGRDQILELLELLLEVPIGIPVKEGYMLTNNH